MRLLEKRIFISDLPETVTPDELKNAFQDYGNVKSTEIKERKELGPKNSSLFFAYVNIEIDDFSLQKCFKDFNNNEWHGQYVQLQIARESFLDRLKREREENPTKQGSSVTHSSTEDSIKPIDQPKILEKQNEQKSESSGSETEIETEKPFKNNINKKIKKESSDSSSSDSEDEKPPINKIGHNKQQIKKETCENNDEPMLDSDFVIKSNKGKQLGKNGLVIESVGKEPIIKIDLSKKKTVNNSEANQKRLQSMNEMRKGYKSQKSLISAALAGVDKKVNKVIFDANENDTKFKKPVEKKKILFDDDDDEKDLCEFKIKEHFEGKKGQKLLELQSKYKNDSRFTLDERFLEDDPKESGEENQENMVNDGDDETNLEEEKQKEFEILGEILGKTIAPKNIAKVNEVQDRKKMLRFDPSQPDHSKYELQNNEPKTTKRKRKDSNSEFNEKKAQETQQPEVSKEVFYKVTGNLKDSLNEKQEFSLLSMFGKNRTEEESLEEETVKQLNQNIVGQDSNPFKYDSSDDEDETINIPNNKEVKETPSTERKQARFWSESFFFKDDDYRLQEGFDFVEKIQTEEKGEFTKLRRDLKEIVRSKVRNNQRKDKPFKKKLGGNKKRKNIRIKKALKR